MDQDLAALFAPLADLRRMQPDALKRLTGLTGGERVIDLLFHLPQSWIDRRPRPTLREARAGEIVTLAIEVVSAGEPVRRGPWRALCQDGTASIEIVLFNPRPWQLAPWQPGARLTVSGRLALFDGRLQMANPDWIAPPDRIPDIEPVWPLAAGVTARTLIRLLPPALRAVPALPEWHDAALLKRERWPGFAAALAALHAPAGMPGPEPRRRLAYDELLASQVAIALVRGRLRRRPGRSLAGDGRLRAEALRRFGHAPTPAQTQAIAEIDADLAAPRRMLRLLQGDVGSGKTLVALMAMLRAAEAGAQAALMAPTEVLARQHHRTFSRLSPVPVALLTGAVKGAERRRILAGLADGSIPLVVGTHALFQEAVAYHDLALAVIDEQHRFGVDQRVTLGGKGEVTDVLVMTATPIPRTLLLTQWGEMEVSRLTGKPAGRKPIATSLHGLAKEAELVDAIARKLGEGAQVYWVCPLVAESEALDVAAAEARFATLQARFGDIVGLAHGRQDPAARDATLAGFITGRIRLLVATTVIEVGVDVPGASVMVIEHAERFGLAQLHQLRGRVGRGSAASFCLLLHAEGLAEGARRRLALLRDTDDGFAIADADFRLRGSGDVLGTRQSGLPGFRLADPQTDEDLLHMANRDAALLLEKDPKLEGPRGRAVRVLLRLFERMDAMRTLTSG